jgi:hypothetical protein
MFLFYLKFGIRKVTEVKSPLKERKSMKYFTVSLFIIMFLFLSCERQETQVTAPETAALEIQPVESPDGTWSTSGTLPAGLQHWWRRVFVEGPHSIYGDHSVQGSSNSQWGSDQAGDWNLSSISGGGFSYWSSGLTNTGTSHIGSYGGKLTTTNEVTTDQDEYSDIGQAISENDTIIYTIWYNKYVNAQLLEHQIRLYEKTGTNTVDREDTQNPTDWSGAWKMYSITKTGLSWDVGYVSAKNPGVRIAADVGYTAETILDDIRLYSSAEDLPPAGRAVTSALESIAFSINTETEPTSFDATVSVWLNEESANLYWYYENSSDGFYYLAVTVNEEVREDVYEFSESDVTIDEGFLEYLEADDTVRMLTATESDGCVLHFNEHDSFIYEH